MAAKLCKEQQTLFGNDMTYIWILLMVRKRSAKLGLKRTLIFKKTSRAVKNFADIFYFNFYLYSKYTREISEKPLEQISVSRKSCKI